MDLNEIENVKQFLDETTIMSKGKETLITNLQMAEADKEKFQEFVEQLHVQKESQTSITT